MSWDVKTHYAEITTTSGYVFKSCTPAHVVRKIIGVKITNVAGSPSLVLSKVEHGSVSTWLKEQGAGELGYYDPKRPILVVQGSGNIVGYSTASGTTAGVTITYVDDTIY